MPPQIPLILIPAQQSDLASELGLPDDDDNLFQRVIRNPRIDAPNPRERECTEMLCAVLRNTTEVRNDLLQWLAELAGQDIAGLDQLDFTIETEGEIGPKRDDLRIEGWQDNRDGRRLVVLWTIEVKVGSSFHESSPLDDGLEEGDARELVNQLRNYDHWLNQQAADHRAGFVLALEDTNSLLPTRLSCRWTCFSWTQLGGRVQHLLRTRKIACHEEFLAKHFLGFIRTHLWRASEMSELRLEFDDVALIRAFVSLGRDCEDKVNRLVEQLVPMIANCDFLEGKVSQQKILFQPSLRSVVWRGVFDPGLCPHPQIVAGIERAQISLWLETPSGNPRKSRFRKIFESVLPRLRERNPLWFLPEQTWYDLELRVPLQHLLSANDQEQYFHDFFKKGLEDLRAVELVEQLRQVLT